MPASAHTQWRQQLQAVAPHPARALGAIQYRAVRENPHRDELSGLQKLKAPVGLWISEKEYDPKCDGAARDWARTSQKMLDAVRAVDE